MNRLVSQSSSSVRRTWCWPRLLGIFRLASSPRDDTTNQPQAITSMERKKATDFPQELLNIFDRYVHGEISRREFLDSAKKYAIGSLTAMAIWESLRPNYALAQQVAKDDKRITTEYVTVSSPQGNGNIRGYFVRPANAGEKLPGVLVIHENRGLNPYIEDVARRLGTSNFLAFAPDGLTSVGGYPGDEEKAAALFKTVDEKKMFEAQPPLRRR